MYKSTIPNCPGSHLRNNVHGSVSESSCINPILVGSSGLTLQINPIESLNSLPWIEALNQYIWQSTGGVDIAIGATQSITDGAAKIRYLAFQQAIEKEQLFLEQQILNLMYPYCFPGPTFGIGIGGGRLISLLMIKAWILHLPSIALTILVIIS